jgi:hypothetical protein
MNPSPIPNPDRDGVEADHRRTLVAQAELNKLRKEVDQHFAHLNKAKLKKPSED